MSDKKKFSGTTLDDPHTGGRRRMLRSLATGGGVLLTGASLPEKWTRPAVQSVLLPAHADTSPQEPEPPTLMSCSIEICEGTGGEGPCQTITSDTTISFGCGDLNGVDVGGESGGSSWPNICTTVTQSGVGVPGLTVELEVTLNGLFPGGSDPVETDQVVTDTDGVACDFQFGPGNDLFQQSTGDTAQFCFTVLDRPDIAPCCITVTWSCILV